MINLWVKCLCLLVSVISSTKHKYLLPCYAPKGCRSQKEAESSEKVSIFHSHLCIMYVWCAAVQPRCIHRLSPNCGWSVGLRCCHCSVSVWTPHPHPRRKTLCCANHPHPSVCLCSLHDETDGCGCCSRGGTNSRLTANFPSRMGQENKAWSFQSSRRHQTQCGQVHVLGSNLMHWVSMLLQPYSYLSKKPANEMKGSSPDRTLAFPRDKKSEISHFQNHWWMED